MPKLFSLTQFVTYKLLKFRICSQKLFVHALGVLDAEGESAKMISLAVHMIGKLSPAIMRFSGKDVLQQAFQRVVAFASFSQRYLISYNLIISLLVWQYVFELCFEIVTKNRFECRQLFYNCVYCVLFFF